MSSFDIALHQNLHLHCLLTCAFSDKCLTFYHLRTLPWHPRSLCNHHLLTIFTLSTNSTQFLTFLSVSHLMSIHLHPVHIHRPQIPMECPSSPSCSSSPHLTSPFVTGIDMTLSSEESSWESDVLLAVAAATVCYHKLILLLSESLVVRWTQLAEVITNLDYYSVHALTPIILLYPLHPTLHPVMVGVWCHQRSHFGNQMHILL